MDKEPKRIIPNFYINFILFLSKNRYDNTKEERFWLQCFFIYGKRDLAIHGKQTRQFARSRQWRQTDWRHCRERANCRVRFPCNSKKSGHAFIAGFVLAILVINPYILSRDPFMLKSTKFHAFRAVVPYETNCICKFDCIFQWIIRLFWYFWNSR